MTAAPGRVRAERILSTSSVVLGAAYLAQALSTGCLRDLSAYVRAVDDLRAGRDPYRYDGHNLRFVYHPLVLWLMRLFDAIDLRCVMFALYGVSVVCCLRALRGVLGASALPVFGLALACGGAGVWSFATGNVTAFMHLALLAVLYTPRRAGSVVCWALLAMLVLIKPYFLAYGLVPVLIERDHVPQLRRWLVVAIGCSAVLLLAWWVAPPWTERFLQALMQQSIGLGNVGMSFFGLLLRALHERMLIALIVHVACALSVIGAAVTYCVTRPLQPSSAIGVLYCALTWANPRMMVYDLFPALLALGTALSLEVPEYAVHAALALGISAVPMLGALLQLGWGVDLGAALRSAALWQTLACCYLAMVLARTAASSTRVPELTPSSSR